MALACSLMRSPYTPAALFFGLRVFSPLFLVCALPLLIFSSTAFAHDVSALDRELLANKSGLQLGLYLWLGAKHMITGYDHLLFLVGVIFYLKRFREIATFATLFAIGHTLTLLGGVLLSVHVNPYLIDAIIGLSVAYKGFDNLGGFDRLWGETPNERMAVMVFGLFHGLGLATKLQDLGLSAQSLVGNLIAFNVGVELGQLAALVVIVLLLRLFTVNERSTGLRVTVNAGLMIAGFSLMAYQLARFFNA